VSHSTARILLGLFIANLGVALGAGLYEGRIVFPEWLVTSPDGELHWNAEAARQSNTGIRFWAFVTTGPLTLLTLANAYGAWRSRGSARRWWLGAVASAVGDRAMTFGYFIPTMVGLLNAPDAAAAVESATRWGDLNYLRHAFVAAALGAALTAYARVCEQGGAARVAKI
jgi:hypothetical protein